MNEAKNDDSRREADARVDPSESALADDDGRVAAAVGGVRRIPDLEIQDP